MEVQQKAVQPPTESRPAPPPAAQRASPAGPETRSARYAASPRTESVGFDAQAPVVERNSTARLSLDQELHRVFVEIVDSKTGDVITRFPPEQLINHIDEVLEQTNRKTNLQDSGLIFDQRF